nr:hypothetical protein [Tanacetum cinerariifolium]
VNPRSAARRLARASSIKIADREVMLLPNPYSLCNPPNCELEAAAAAGHDADVISTEAMSLGIKKEYNNSPVNPRSATRRLARASSIKIVDREVMLLPNPYSLCNPPNCELEAAAAAGHDADVISTEAMSSGIKKEYNNSPV